MEAQRIRAQVLAWDRAEGVNAAVAVAVAEQREEAHHADDELVAPQRRGRRGELVRCPVEGLARDGVVRIRVLALQLGDQRADVAGRIGPGALGAITATARRSTVVVLTGIVRNGLYQPMRRTWFEPETVSPGCGPPASA